MTNVTVTISPPASRTDGTPLAPTDIGSYSVFRSDGTNNVLVGTVPSSTSPLVVVDTNVPVGSYTYTATDTDNQTPPLTSAASAPVTIVIAPPALAAPNPPTIAAAQS